MLSLAVVIETDIKAITKHHFLLISLAESNKSKWTGSGATKQRWIGCGVFYFVLFCSLSSFFHVVKGGFWKTLIIVHCVVFKHSTQCIKVLRCCFFKASLILNLVSAYKPACSIN